jgi:hypothetical protein
MNAEIVCLTVGLTALAAASAAGRSNRPERDPSRALTARNVQVSPELAPCVGMMLQRSVTFRALYDALARREQLIVGVSLDLGQPPRTRRAETQIRRFSSGLRVAAVTVYGVRDLVELIAHELEHVREQMEGVNLTLQAVTHGPGVTRLGNGAFETTRAVDVGRTVANEVGYSGERTCLPVTYSATLAPLPY